MHEPRPRRGAHLRDASGLASDALSDAKRTFDAIRDIWLGILLHLVSDDGYSLELGHGAASRLMMAGETDSRSSRRAGRKRDEDADRYCFRRNASSRHRAISQSCQLAARSQTLWQPRQACGNGGAPWALIARNILSAKHEQCGQSYGGFVKLFMAAGLPPVSPTSDCPTLVYCMPIPPKAHEPPDSDVKF